MVAVTPGLCPTVTVAVAVHPLASVTVTVTFPLGRLFSVLPVPPLLQAYVYPEVPPEAVAVAVPLEEPQFAFVEDVFSVTGVGSLMVTFVTAVQPLASVVVTE